MRKRFNLFPLSIHSLLHPPFATEVEFQTSQFHNKKNQKQNNKHLINLAENGLLHSQEMEPRFW
jgi:hypothetical protein